MIDRFEYGAGSLVILCHGAASHSGQWKALIELLSPDFHVVAFDQYGYRHSTAWSQPRPMLYQDQAAPIIDFIRSKIAQTRSTNTELNNESSTEQQNVKRLQNRIKVHLVGHSHGASIATNIALALGSQVTSLSLYEPNSFTALKNDPIRHGAYQQILQEFGDLEKRVSSLEDQTRFAKDLMNFWLGPDQWSSLSSRQQAQLISVMPQTVHEVYAALHSPFDIQALKTLKSRVLMMYDPFTPLRARMVSEHYAATLSQAHIKLFKGYRHLAPITHAQQVNQVIQQHISKWESDQSE